MKSSGLKKRVNPKSIVVLGYFLMMSVCHAEFFSASLLTADWKVNQASASCRLQQEIPLYGVADFLQKSGESLRFSIREERFKPEIVKASLSIETPPWLHHSVFSKDYLVLLDSIGGHQSYPRLSVYGEPAEAMLDALLKGLYPTFSYVRASVYGFSPEVNVAVSSINFFKNYQQFDACRKGFLPGNFKQMLEQSLFFKPGSKRLSGKVLDQLNDAVRYIKEVQGAQLVIVSDTAIAGGQDKSWFLRRAKVIESKLSGLGVPKTKIKIKAGVQRSLFGNKTIRLSIFGPDALKAIYYRKGNTRLTLTEKKRLGLLIRYVDLFLPDTKLIINSHTDSKGKKVNNLRISQQRGEEIKRYLISQGMNDEKVQVKAYGESKPVKSNRFPRGRAQNRRAVIDFLG